MDVTKLNDIIPHLRYEWRQINLMYQLLMRFSDRRDELPPGAWSAYVESFVMNARVLIDVLYHSRKFSSDVVAADFLRAPDSWPALRGSEHGQEVRDIVDRVNQQVAHLTYRRTEYSPTDFLWDVHRVVELLRSPMEKLEHQTQQEGKVELLGPDERTFLAPSNQCKLTAATTGVSIPQDKSSIHGRTDL